MCKRFCERSLNFCRSPISHISTEIAVIGSITENVPHKFCNSLHKPKIHTNYIIPLPDNPTFLTNNGCC